jgi:glycerol uptake facilitator protein
MHPYGAEFIGTAILVFLGNGVVANVLLTGTKGHGGGWIVITAGWGFAVFTAVLCVADLSGAHINPAVTVGLVLAGEFAAAKAPGFIIAQMLGGIFGGCLVYVFYQPHYAVTDDADLKLGTFCTAPAIRNTPNNLFCEATGTLILVLAVLLASSPTFDLPGVSEETTSVEVGLGAIGAMPVGIIVFAIGLCLGGTTGYAINPARDLGPRIAHAILPVPGKRDSDWSYSWIPVVGPLLGAVLAALLYGVMSASTG